MIFNLAHGLQGISQAAESSCIVTYAFTHPEEAVGCQALSD